MGDHRQTSKTIWLATKWVVFVVVLGFVAWHSWTLWNQLGPAPTHLNWGWLALAAVLSIVAWLPSAWYWRWIMVRLGAIAPWPQAMRAYFCGALGKYLPGKAAVIVLRAALLKPVGVPATTASLAVLHETLTFMWVGGVSVMLLYPSLARKLPDWFVMHGDHPLLPFGFLAGWVISGIVALTMLLRSHRTVRGFFGSPRSATVKAIGQDLPPPAEVTTHPGSRSSGSSRLVSLPDGRGSARKTAGADAGSVGHETASGPVHLSLGRSLRMTLVGGVVLLAGWWIHGLTLGLTICAVIGDRTAWSDWPFWTGSAAVAVVGGFVVLFAPGGLGVREGLLLELLERQLGPREAVLVTVLWRGALLVGEIAAAGALYYGVEGVEKSKESDGSGVG